MNYIIVTAKSDELLLIKERKIGTLIASKSPEVHNPYLAISNYIPSLERQKENYQLIQNNLLRDHLLAYLKQIGVLQEKTNAIYHHLTSMPFKPLTINKWLKSLASDDLSFLYLGEIKGSYVSIILLSSQLSYDQLTTIVKDSAEFTLVNQADDISSIFHKYRIILSWLILAAFAAFMLLLWLRYGYRKIFLLILPPLFASGLALSFNVLCAIPVTIFTIFAIILVLGIAVDYVLFFAETKNNYESTMLATMLSAMTTILSFGLLSFSSTPAVRYFGITVFIGILAAFLLAPIATTKNKATHTDNH